MREREMKTCIEDGLGFNSRACPYPLTPTHPPKKKQRKDSFKNRGKVYGTKYLR